MGQILDRSVQRIGPNGQLYESKPLAAYRDTPAYVLLGDPGAGKTTAFETEARAEAAQGNALFLSARDFLAGEPNPEWRGRTLLIDGLDEVRAGEPDGRRPFDRIHSRLDELKRPPFRLSCREADWLGSNDRKHLEKVSPNREVVVLRLEPLTGEEARRLVSERPDIGDPEEFLREARGRGLDGLLRNPQNLTLLAKVFGTTGEWPASRRETFEQASKLLAREENEEHRIGNRNQPLMEALEALLDAAGRLSAVQLLSGAAGHALSRDDAPQNDWIPITAHGDECRDALRAVLGTRLFSADRTSAGKGFFRPQHAHLAAFLAARWLSRLVAESLPRGRVLALLAGTDDVPPTPLRGLAAWLAAASPALRRPLIERDPAAVLLYGDVTESTLEEKRLLFHAVGRESNRLGDTGGAVSALGALATPDLEPTLKQALRDPDRRVVEVAMMALSSARLASRLALRLADELLEIVRDDSRESRVRRSALDTWIASLQNEPDRVGRLRSLLDEIHQGRIHAPDGELPGRLLDELYPGGLEPAEVWDYLPHRSRPVMERPYGFWQRLYESCPKDHLPIHLDRLSGAGPLASTWLERTWFDRSLRSSFSRLLARGLERYGTEVEPLRLFHWLQAGAAAALDQPRDQPRETFRPVAAWLEANPDVQKAVIRTALRAKESPALDALLYRSSLPEDIGRCHLDEAKRWKQLRSETAPPHAPLLEAVRRSADELRANRGRPELLFEIAEEYYAGSYEPGAHSRLDRRNRLTEALGGDEALTTTALGAVLDTSDRPDLPSAKEILAARRRDRMHLLVLPVLAAAAEMEPDRFRRLTKARLRTVLACRLCFHDQYAFSQEADWYWQCVQEQPELAAEVLVIAGRILLQAGEIYIPDFHRLAHEERHEPVARRAVLPLLRAFPARAREGQLGLLDALLLSGLRYLDSGSGEAAFRELIERKAAQKSTTRGARLRWLTAGLVLDPDRFLAVLSAELRGSEARVRNFAGFFRSLGSSPPPGLIERLTPPVLELTIRTLGRSTDPLPPGRTRAFDGVSPDLIESLIGNLSRSPEAQTTRILCGLASDPELSAWRSRLEHALDTQRVIRRDADYRPPAPEEVIATLADGPPASAADLRALVVDRLEQIAEETRTTNANLWRQFWNEDRHARPTEPKPENSCRDALLPLLRSKLPRGCEALPEQQHAGGRRADLRIACGGFAVPVEIKKNCHRELWQAVQKQLLPHYANDPAAAGLGIFLVLWFGPERTAPAEEGSRPRTPEELRERLVAQLTPEERQRAAVIVLDVTPP